MNTFTFIIQGSLKPTAMRHHVFELGKFLGIHGFLNYRKGMLELFIHAEGEEETMVEFTNHVNQLVKNHKLKCVTESATFEDCRDFKILSLSNGAVNNPIHDNLLKTITPKPLTRIYNTGLRRQKDTYRGSGK